MKVLNSKSNQKTKVKQRLPTFIKRKDYQLLLFRRKQFQAIFQYKIFKNF